MARTISCPHCLGLMELPADYHGGHLRCPHCRAVFQDETSTALTAQAPLGPLSTDVREGRADETWPARTEYRDEDDDRLLERIRTRRPFKPSGGMGLAVRTCLVLNILLCAATIFGDYLQYKLTVRLKAGEIVPAAELDANDLRQMVLGVATLFLTVANVVFFVVWFYRAHANLEALGARRLTYTSGWAAGSWFVPILNWFRPVQIAQEIWRKSDPQALGDNRFAASTNSSLIGFWWAAWLISGIVSNVTARITWSANTPDALQAATVGNMFAEVLTIISAVLALAVVVAIDARQNERAGLMRLTGEVHEDRDLQ